MQEEALCDNCPTAWGQVQYVSWIHTKHALKYVDAGRSNEWASGLVLGSYIHATLVGQRFSLRTTDKGRHCSFCIGPILRSTLSEGKYSSTYIYMVFPLSGALRLVYNEYIRGIFITTRGDA